MPIPSKLQPWFEARQRFRLSHAHIQMARELGLNPKKFGSLANERQEPWKRPLGEFIEYIYFKRFGKTQPTSLLSIEEQAEEKRERKRLKREAANELNQDVPSESSEEGPHAG